MRTKFGQVQKQPYSQGLSCSRPPRVIEEGGNMRNPGNKVGAKNGNLLRQLAERGRKKQCLRILQYI